MLNRVQDNHAMLDSLCSQIHMFPFTDDETCRFSISVTILRVMTFYSSSSETPFGGSAEGTFDGGEF